LEWRPSYKRSPKRDCPYKKDDNAHIEQKNWTHVRKLLGWERYDTQNAVGAMNDLYRRELRLWLNLYLPSVKLVKKVRVGSKVRRVYDGPKTPLERVVASRQGDAAQLSILKELQSSLDPFQLAKTIDRKLERISNGATWIARVTFSNGSTRSLFPESTEIGRVRSGGVRALVYSVGRQRQGW
jgi:hypothetical protein